MERREQAQRDFAALARAGRESPVAMQAFVANRVEYMAACEEVYHIMWEAIADTGVQILRDEDGKKVTTNLARG